MYKSIAAAIAVVALAPASAFAGPYANVETNAGWAGSRSLGAATDVHVGFDGTAGNASYYIQGGPQIQTPNGGATEVVFSAKAGAGVDLTEKLTVYGELSVASGADGADNGYGGKLGATYSF